MHIHTHTHTHTNATGHPGRFSNTGVKRRETVPTPPVAPAAVGEKGLKAGVTSLLLVVVAARLDDTRATESISEARSIS